MKVVESCVIQTWNFRVEISQRLGIISCNLHLKYRAGKQARAHQTIQIIQLQLFLCSTDEFQFQE